MIKEPTLYVLYNGRKYGLKIFNNHIGVERLANDVAKNADTRSYPKTLGLMRLYDGQAWNWEVIAQTIATYEMELATKQE